MGEGRLHSRLMRVFLLNVVVISVTTICGILAAAFVVEKMLVNRALISEAEYFWKHREASPAHPLPNTLNLQSYLDRGDGLQVPARLFQLDEGQHRVDYAGGKPIVYVSRKGTETLYLIFQERQVSQLAFLFGVLPLILVLLVLYGLAYLSFLGSKKAVSPIVALANRVETFDFAHSNSEDLVVDDLPRGSNTEVELLIQAFRHLSERMQRMLQRERNFTRYASHELRTPLAVIKGSVASLELAELDRLPKRALERIKRTSADMESLLDTLLLLAREQEVGVDGDEVVVNDLVALLVEPAAGVRAGVPVTVKNDALLRVQAPEKVLSILLGNIIRNAQTYTEEGSVTVSIDAQKVVVTDTGKGIDQEHLQRIFEPFFRAREGNGDGYGLGLAIVKRICDEYGWRTDVESTPGEGTRFAVIFSPRMAVRMRERRRSMIVAGESAR